MGKTWPLVFVYNHMFGLDVALVNLGVASREREVAELEAAALG